MVEINNKFSNGDIVKLSELAMYFMIQRIIKNREGIFYEIVDAKTLGLSLSYMTIKTVKECRLEEVFLYPKKRIFTKYDIGDKVHFFNGAQLSGVHEIEEILIDKDIMYRFKDTDILSREEAIRGLIHYYEPDNSIPINKYESEGLGILSENYHVNDVILDIFGYHWRIIKIEIKEPNKLMYICQKCQVIYNKDYQESFKLQDVTIAISEEGMPEICKKLYRLSYYKHTNYYKPRFKIGDTVTLLYGHDKEKLSDPPTVKITGIVILESGVHYFVCSLGHSYYWNLISDTVPIEQETLDHF